MATWSKMLFLGDSLTHGSRDPYGLAWPYYMAHLAILEEKYVVIPELDAVPGRTSAEMVRSVYKTIEGSDAQEAFLLIGTNDTKEDILLPVEEYIGNLRLMEAWCRVNKKRPYVLTIPKPQGFGSVAYTRKNVELIDAYNRGIRSAGFANVIDLGDSVCQYTDGIHFSVEGNRRVARIVWDYLVYTRSYGQEFLARRQKGRMVEETEVHENSGNGKDSGVVANSGVVAKR